MAKLVPRTITELSHATAEMLKRPLNGPNRFASMDLCQEIMERIDQLHYSDEETRFLLRSWIGKIQNRFQRGSS